MADELVIAGRKLDQPKIEGAVIPMEGTFVPGSAKELDADNTDTYTVSHGVEYVSMYARSALWYRIDNPSANAALGVDEFLGANERVQRVVSEGQIIKALIDT